MAWALGILGMAWLPGVARADDLADFQAAQAHYDAMEYPEAVEAFTALVGSDPPKLRNSLLVLESRKYLAAALVFVGRTTAARDQFVKLLRTEPDYTIDPLAFPAKVVTLFDSVKRDLSEEIRARERAETLARAKEQAAREAVERERKARLRTLRELAEEEFVVQKSSRWLATVPFGVGQIQNGHRAFGRFLAVAESVLLITSVATWAVHSSLSNDVPEPSDVAQAEQLERNLRIANYASFGTFIGFVGYGIADAHLRFVPSRRVRRERQLPEDLDRWVETELSATGLRLRF